MSQPDPYLILRVSRRASKDEIKKSYRKLSVECHPDKFHGDAGKAEEFKILSAAYELLMDDQRRALYDRYEMTEAMDLYEQARSHLKQQVIPTLQRFKGRIIGVDFIEVMMKRLRDEVTGEKQAIAEDQRAVRYLEDLKGRFTSYEEDEGNIFVEEIDSELMKARKKAGVHRFNIDALERAIEILNHYEYEVMNNREDLMALLQGTGNHGTVRRQINPGGIWTYPEEGEDRHG